MTIAYESKWRLDWLKALHKGDCLEIERLLLKDERLVTIYPRSEPCKDAADFATHFKGWRGCSALHVAVKRGWPFLVQTIVNLFKEEPQASSNIAESAATSDAGARSDEEMREPVLSLRELEELLLALDGDYHLDALALAVVDGNETIVKILATASSRCESNPYRVPLPLPFPNPTGSGEVDRGITGWEGPVKRENLSNLAGHITMEILRALTDTHTRLEGVQDSNAEVELYRQNPAYNFLPVELFFSHHLIASEDKVLREEWLQCMTKKFRELDEGSELREYMFSLKDGRGKTLAHVLVTRRRFQLLNMTIDEREQFFQVRDGAGGTPGHELVAGLLEFASQGTEVTIYRMFGAFTHSSVLHETYKKHRCCKEGLFEYFDLDALYVRNGYDDYDFHAVKKDGVLHESSALSLAALHNCSSLLEYGCWWHETTYIRLPKRQIKGLGKMFRTDLEEWGVAQVAALARSDKVFRWLVEDDKVRDPESIVFLASHVGDPTTIQILLRSGRFDPLITTYSGNTALHFAARANYSGPVLKPTLLDLVNVSHRPGVSMPHSYRFSDEEEGPKREEFIRAADSRRKGCINLLLQAGIDIWQENNYGIIADPGERGSSEFCSWWYEKVTKETQDLKINLNFAANAISVTAALVATASFVGPLQPPLGYSGPTEMVQVESRSVRVFMVCDTLALYFAVVSIMLSLMPLLPLPQESTLNELSHVRKIVTAAVFFLIISVVSFLVGFAAGSIAVIPNNGSWNSGGLTLSTVIAGDIFIVYLIYLYLLRLVRLICHRWVWLRRNYRKLTLIN